MLTPHDDALLNDLLDGRLDPSSARAVEARLTREPALKEAHDELLRVRGLIAALPEPVPPPDFVARVRERLAAEPASPDALPPTRSAPASGPALPPAWRRAMLVAYATAAVVVLAVGLFALRRDEPVRDASPRPAPEGGAWETAAAPEAERATRRETQAEAAAAPVPAPSASAPPAAPPEGAPAPMPPMRGPGGALPPGLRKPSDGVVKKAEAEAGAKDAKAGEPEPAGTLAAPVPPLLLVLEAQDAVAGKARLQALLAGRPTEPSARGAGAPAADAPSAPAPLTLRRADATSDAALLALLAVRDEPRAASDDDAPPAPAAPASDPVTAAAPSPRLLDVVLLELTPAEAERLDAVLAPRPADGGGAPSAGRPAGADERARAVPRRVRVLIVPAR
jgi:negative regulator of sigma E activity